MLCFALYFVAQYRAAIRKCLFAGYISRKAFTTTASLCVKIVTICFRSARILLFIASLYVAWN